MSSPPGPIRDPMAEHGARNTAHAAMRSRRVRCAAAARENPNRRVVFEVQEAS